MSEPARHYAPHEPASRPQPGPLRDWLAAMKAATMPSTSPEEVERPAAETAPAADVPTQAPAPATANQWIPRVVAPDAKPVGAAQSDISDLMAENLMLKAKLKVETDRYDSLQALIARELRNLRSHVEEDMRDLEDIRAERDRLVEGEAASQRELQDLRARHDELAAREEAALRDLHAARSEITDLAENLTEMRNERDLWAARAEALAQPIFQRRPAA